MLRIVVGSMIARVAVRPTKKARKASIFLAVSLAVFTVLSAPSFAADPEKSGEKQADQISAEHVQFFENKIRPMLVKHCYECHSEKAEELKGNLRLDTAVGVRTGGDFGPAVVAGKPEESPLIDALRYETLEMPPGGKLPDAVIADFEKWVSLGAPDPRNDPATVVPAGDRRVIDIEAGKEFWSFQPFQRHDPPKLETEREGSLGRIDAFIHKRLADKGIAPPARAEQSALVRRLYFDLTGLPPTPEQLAAATNDASPEAYDKLVDELLASPQFGVHWARHWLDVVRYADSNGGDFNATFHNAWRYRDYVIQAMNEDLPYGQFVREQIAGDLLPYETDADRRRQLIASGYLMLGAKMLSERDKEKLRMDVVDEQINTTGQAFLGLTLGCARCHDHKFDPIPTRDYYALAGIFRSTIVLEGESQQYVSTWKRTQLPADPELLAKVDAYQQQLKELEGVVAATKKELQTANKELAALKNGSDPLLVDDSSAKKIGTWKDSSLTPPFVGKGYIHDDKTAKGERSVTFTLQPTVTAEYEVRVSYTHSSGRASNVPVTVTHADGETVVHVNQAKKPDIDGMFTAAGRFTFAADKPAVVTISNDGTTGFVIVDAVRLVQLDSEGNFVEPKLTDNPEEYAETQSHVAELEAQLKKSEQELAAFKKDSPPALPEAFAARENKEIGDCHVCIRGDHRAKGEVVPRGFVQVAMQGPQPSFSGSESGRLELADWIASEDNPLTARVMVNRVWYHLLGEGLVRTVDNFGKLGDRPSHPLLLDDLAARFVEPKSEAGGMGWSIKDLIREVVLSETYQATATYRQEAFDADPENRLLWQAHRKRLPAESIRDSLLAISGRLDLSEGGSPVEGFGTLVRNNDAGSQGSNIEETPRRSIYLPIIRNELPSLLTVFDFADPDLVVGKRPVTNVPSQSLLLMNSPEVMEAADATAKLIFAPEQDAAETVAKAYAKVLSRQPTESEVARGVAYLTFTPNDKPLAPEEQQSRLAKFVHVLFASAEFRLLN